MRQTNKRKTTIILIVMLMLLVEIIILGFSRANNIKEIQTTIKDYGKNLKEDNLIFDFSGKNQTDITFRNFVELLNEFVSEKEKLFIRNSKANELIESYNKNKVFPVFKNNSYDHFIVVRYK